MDKEIKKLATHARTGINSASVLADLEKIYLEIFGKSGTFTNLTKQLSSIPKSKKPKIGQLLNEAKKEIEKTFEQRHNFLKKKRPKEFIDITAPGKKLKLGHLHLISQAIDEIVAIFSKLGFSLESYPEVDWDWYAFESLNIQPETIGKPFS